MNFNTIKSSLFCKFYTVSPFFLSELDVLKSHLMRNLMINFQPNVFISDLVG